MLRSLVHIMLAGTASAFVAGCSLRLVPEPTLDEEQTYGACNPLPCLRVTFDELEVVSPSIPESALFAIQSEVRRVLYAPLESSEGEYTKARVLSEVKVQFDEYLKVSDAASTAEWTLSRAASALYVDSKLISVSVTNEGYLGGAHGFQEVTYLVFDAQSGKKLSWSDILSEGSQSVLLKASEAEFRRIRQIPADQSLADAGFDFSPDGVFKLSANFAVSGQGLHLHYNAYEVGPYVMGPTDIIVPMEVFSGVARSDTPALEGVLGSKGAML